MYLPLLYGIKKCSNLPQVYEATTFENYKYIRDVLFSCPQLTFFGTKNRLSKFGLKSHFQMKSLKFMNQKLVIAGEHTKYLILMIKLAASKIYVQMIDIKHIQESRKKVLFLVVRPVRPPLIEHSGQPFFSELFLQVQKMFFFLSGPAFTPSPLSGKKLQVTQLTP